jgi:ornithine cyclodeaminase
MQLRVLGAAALREALPMTDTIEAMKTAFAAYSNGQAVVPRRLAVQVPSEQAVLLVKPALLPGDGLGAKLVSVFPGNAKQGKPVVTGLVVLLDPTTGEPAGLCDGAFLTAWRTGAASGAATDLLARQDATVAAVIGCGAQGRTQALAIDAVRPLEVLRVFDTDAYQIGRFTREMGSEVGARIVPARSPEDAVDGAHVICTATTSSVPVVTSGSIADGAHVNGVGSFTSAMCEVDGGTIRRARVVVDSRDSALAEAGELIRAVDQGWTSPEQWAELGEVVDGSRSGRESDDEVTFFKSVGLAAQDIAAAALAFRRAAELGLGTEIDLG